MPAFSRNLALTFCMLSLLVAYTLPTTAVAGEEPQFKWTACGWGGGAFYWSAAWHPSDENVIYMGSDCMGAYRTDDKGLHWHLVNNGLCGYEVLCLAVSPAAPDLVYALTSAGLCKSNNRGKNWEFITESGPTKLEICAQKYATIRAIAIDPKNAEVVYAGSRTGKLFKTENGGKTWKELPYRDAIPKIEPPLPPKKSDDSVSTVAISPTNPSEVCLTSTKLGVFRSQDAGATWTLLAAPKTGFGVAISPVDPNVICAACGESGLHRSLDGGKTWTDISSELLKKTALLEVILTNKPDVIYAIGSSNWSGHLFRTDDGGKTWSHFNRVKSGLPGNPTLPNGNDANGFTDISTVTNIAVNPKNPDELFMSGNWRNMFSADGGKTLEERSTGADNTCTTDIQFLNGKTYVTAMDEGLFVSENKGEEWRQLIPIKYDATVSGHFWRVRVTTVGGSTRIVTSASPWNSSSNLNDPKYVNRVYVSGDEGKTFTATIAGLPNYVPNVNCMWGRSYPRSLAMDPKNSDILYLGMDGNPEPAKNLPGGGIFRSADGGKTWTRCASQPGGLRLYYGLVIDPANSKRLYFSSCGEGGGAWRSDDEGATWTHIFQNESWCFNLDVSPSGVVYVGGKDLWRSDDQGKTWRKLTNFQDATLVGIAIDPANEQRIWISRTTWDDSIKGGVFRTSDGGQNWTDMTGDIPCHKLQLMRYNPVTKELWAGGPGLFRIQQ
jgi:photosystem II stability/assembly factor-like uncharacterized protein